MPGELLVDEPADGVVRLTISNPEKRNALDHAILDAIAERRARRSTRAASCSPAPTGCSPSGYDIGDIPERRLRASRPRSSSPIPFTSGDRGARGLPVPDASPRCRATRSAAGSSSRCPATCASPRDGILLGMPPAKLGLVYSHTGLRQLPRRDRRAAHPRAVPARPQRRRRDGAATGGWSTASSARTSSQAAALELAAELAGQRAAVDQRQQARDPRAAARRGRAGPATSSAS